ncbi:hypothetical protein [Aureimonas phyllosphaerae]|uniref:Uncharacterized protein n=1 Tax=Aureimonas phyllosphaerae TaxID=1166078 RepID=A0A7W6C212_9HYPH|nr:hypothetical protein [Aureimonas phyllosphaerae]MBB3938051.1 hypothetical protein [Aureimonas phyllosphaerae]MBB3962073.1 hypothetical protein [Aureimonas phyllosphaerae]SFF55058.1 hypothetical protein SAMN05216566_12613 [Aureimonas phyllosphaerae]
MKSPKQPMKAILAAATQEALEGMAETLFAALAVKQALTTAAGRGLHEWTLAAPGPVNLRHTQAAIRLMAWLDNEQLDYDWQPRVIPATTPGTGGTAHDLLIRWDGGRLSVDRS